MDYNYELLGDERFQELCSSIICKEFKNVQVFPIGQPDGGRDSIVYIMDTTNKEFYVFQVKFVRNANHIKDAHKWISGIVNDEIDKIEKLIPKGASRYYLLTNVKGTGHSEVGSIDKINKLLEEKIKIPALCWWREDINALFEKDTMFKWSYLELLNGQDMLNSVLFDHINEDKDRRKNVINSYLSDQHLLDDKVKFKQIDLQNQLFDLFTDVPIAMSKVNKIDKQLQKTLKALDVDVNGRHYNEYFNDVRHCGNAAEFLLHPLVQNNISKILLEGGPGQGKSTISQFICQVHRTKLLNSSFNWSIFSNEIRNAPTRLPFKIDLRHVADWIEKKNPYEDTISEEYFNYIWEKSLESFMVGHIYYHSKIKDFNTNDLITIMKLSPCLLVFDGFDEIANIGVREEVILMINRAINRLNSNAISLQIIVTSRPAVFSDTISFSKESFPHFELCDLDKSSTKRFVEKWTVANNLDRREIREVKKLVNEKLSLPHLRDLAKSPMQLTILLSLLRTRGESLPDKRTALYDSYIDLFFSRESEKNTLVRDYRELIMDIHEYLAWVLHSEAELENGNGVIKIDDLRECLNKYLEYEGHDLSITDKLFRVVEERVCALVSRVQGTFEFEVQPLREYFCAKYLYNTAAYSPAGNEKKGTKPDRFEAIAHNFYWQNVLRFFVGCFSKGELPLLTLKLKELSEDGIFRYIDYPRVVTSQLMADYVFKQYPRLLNDAVKIIIDGINIGYIINQNNIMGLRQSIMIPKDCGRDAIINECFSKLKKFPCFEKADDLIDIINNNPLNVKEQWESYLFELSGNEKTLWLEYGYRLQQIHKTEIRLLLDVLEEEEYKYFYERINIIVDGNMLKVIKSSKRVKELFLSGILNADVKMRLRNKNTELYSLMHLILNNFFIRNSYDKNTIRMLTRSFFSNELFYDSVNDIENRFDIEDEYDEKCFDFIKEVFPMILESNNGFKKDITYWNKMVMNLEKNFGDTWKAKVLSVVAANVKTEDIEMNQYSDLYDESKELCLRARYARINSTNAKYWKEIFSSNEMLLFKLLLFFTWCSVKTFFNVGKIVESYVDKLSNGDYLKLVDTLEIIGDIYPYNSIQYAKLIKEEELVSQSNRVKFLISYRLKDENRIRFLIEEVDENITNHEELNKIKMTYYIDEFIKVPDDKEILESISECYLKIDSQIRSQYYYLLERDEKNVNIPLELAKNIMGKCDKYPNVIVTFAERVCKKNAYESVIPVAEIASKDGWFL